MHEEEKQKWMMNSPADFLENGRKEAHKKRNFGTTSARYYLDCTTTININYFEVLIIVLTILTTCATYRIFLG